jgi:hypothetical protein
MIQQDNELLAIASSQQWKASLERTDGCPGQASLSRMHQTKLSAHLQPREFDPLAAAAALALGAPRSTSV